MTASAEVHGGLGAAARICRAQDPSSQPTLSDSDVRVSWSDASALWLDPVRGNLADGGRHSLHRSLEFADVGPGNVLCRVDHLAGLGGDVADRCREFVGRSCCRSTAAPRRLVRHRRTRLLKPFHQSCHRTCTRSEHSWAEPRTGHAPVRVLDDPVRECRRVVLLGDGVLLDVAVEFI